MIVLMPNPQADLSPLQINYAYTAHAYLSQKWALRDHPICAENSGITKKTVESLRRKYKRMKNQLQVIYDAEPPIVFPDVIF